MANRFYFAPVDLPVVVAEYLANPQERAVDMARRLGLTHYRFLSIIRANTDPAVRLARRGRRPGRRVQTQQHTCEFCGRVREVLPHRAARRFCSRTCWRAASSGSLNPRFGKLPPGRCIYEAGGRRIAMRSRWELAVARYLDREQRMWKYEPHRFEFGHQSYAPDFLLTENTEYVEVKARWWKGEREKFDAFRAAYPMVKVSVWDQAELETRGIVNEHGKVCYVV